MRPRFISIPTFRHFFDWLKSRLDEKANAVHEHAEYLSELPLPLTKIGETDGQMTYDGQVVTGGGGGEPAWGEYGQYKRVVVPEESLGTHEFFDFMRDNYSKKPGLYVFVEEVSQLIEGLNAYSEDGVLITHLYEPVELAWMDVAVAGIDPFTIDNIPELFQELQLVVWDNFEMEGEPIAILGNPPPKQDVIIDFGVMMYQPSIYDKGVSELSYFVTHKRPYYSEDYYSILHTDPYNNGRWTHTENNQTVYYGNPYPEP